MLKNKLLICYVKNIKLTFDGCGINDANDPYHRRLFTIPRQNCDEYRELSYFIVRAVNSHGTLLEAAKKALLNAQMAGSGQGQAYSNSELCEFLGEAIARAEKGE
jgi:hypothetical protein